MLEFCLLYEVNGSGGKLGGRSILKIPGAMVGERLETSVFIFQIGCFLKGLLR